MKILVGMSGGIDSSVVAHMLAEQGHELVGVRFTLWTDPLAPAIAEILPSKCCNAQTAARSKKVAEDLGIELKILDLENKFKQSVVDPFLQGYAEGRTPNPCIGCNRSIKFGRLLELADKLGCDKLATGHYARVEKDLSESNSSVYRLLEAADANKDQSYYLYGLNQKQLSKVLFPLGTMMKSEVFSLAEKYDIPYEDTSYRESQDLCFFPEKTPTEFLKRHLKEATKTGDIVRRDGSVVGKHKGLPLYTIGQRRIGVGGLRIPLEVVEKDVQQNRLIVADKDTETTFTLEIKDVSWVRIRPKEQVKHSFECRVRSLSTKIPCSVTYSGATGAVTFSSPIPHQATGQSIVFYQDNEVIGGGVMVDR